MIRLPLLFAFAALALALGPTAQAAGLLAHQAEYRITLGAAENATPIGTVRQKLTNCQGAWKLERDVQASVALTQALRFDIDSTLRAEETVNGNSLTYRLHRAVNGERSQRDGTVTLTTDGGGAAILNTPEGRKMIDLPSNTVLPVALTTAAIQRLQRGADSFALEAFDMEVISDNFLIKGSLIDPQELPPRLPNGVEPEKIGARTWPILLQFFRADRPTDPPMFQARLRLHETGVISRMILTYGWVNFGIDLTGITPLPRSC
ncbi:MAG: DUF1849 family protein [Reyranellaceae bacterium]